MTSGDNIRRVRTFNILAGAGVPELFAPFRSADIETTAASRVVGPIVVDHLRSVVEVGIEESISDPKVIRTYAVYMTGKDIPVNARHCASSTDLKYHLYEVAR